MLGIYPNKLYYHLINETRNSRIRTLRPIWIPEIVFLQMKGELQYLSSKMFISSMSRIKYALNIYFFKLMTIKVYMFIKEKDIRVSYINIHIFKHTF